METKTIVRVNNVDIIATSDEQLIAIRPICAALGVDVDSQRKRIERDEILGPTAVMMTVVAADRKEREMYCIPLRYVFGWLFSIDTSRVNEEARLAVAAYKKECYHALYHHFFGTQRRQLEQNRQEIALLEELAELNQQQQQLKQTIADKRRKLEKLRDERLKNEPQLID